MLTSPDPAHVESYRAGALQFVELLGAALGQAGRDFASVEACLEVGCGYGRIVRELRKEIPAERIHVTDVISEGARFAATEFGVTREPPLEQGGATRGARFDLVYLLSVYTHLRRDMVEANLRRVADSLRPGGIVVFTIHGQGSADTAERYEQYWLDKARVKRSLAAEGVYYERYPYYYGEYGLTWFTRETVEAMVEATAPTLERVAYWPMAVDGHQDVFVYRRAT